MAVTAISIADARRGARISIGPGGPVQGVFVVRESVALDSGRVAVELQPVEGGAVAEATFPGEFTVGLVPDGHSAAGG